MSLTPVLGKKGRFAKVSFYGPGVVTKSETVPFDLNQNSERIPPILLRGGFNYYIYRVMIRLRRAALNINNLY